MSSLSRRLYLRIWLAIVVTVVVLTLAVGGVWRWTLEQNTPSLEPPARDIVLRDAQGATVLAGKASRVAGGRPGEPLELRIDTPEGHSYQMQLAMRPPRERGGPREPGPVGHALAAWRRSPWAFAWMLGLVAAAVALGAYPVVRRLTQRLEGLQRSVQRFGDGDLSARVPEGGQDEVADLARQFNTAAARIEKLVVSHKSLLANASHELRSPLTRLRMGLELLGEAPPTPAARAELQRNIAELDQLVEEILLASRLDAPEADMGPTEMVDLVGLAAEECARVDAELDVQAPPEALELPGVSRLLRRALRNLLENARRYSEGEITVTLRREGAWAEVRVADQGPGVPPALRERIFEPFYRLPGASERAGGVGLGLALVRSITERHHGTVHCEDRPEGLAGACFVLRLPL